LAYPVGGNPVYAGEILTLASGDNQIVLKGWFTENGK
jgi:hypothetical protein